MSLAGNVSALSQRVAAEFKAQRALFGNAQMPNGAVGQTVRILANPATALPAGVTWDSGGAPDMTGGRRIIDLVFDGLTWLGTYSPLIPLAAPGTLASTILSFNPAGYWKLDETSGTQATDSSGNNRHGTYNGAYTLNARDGAPDFYGGYVEIPDDDVWTVGGSGITLFAIGHITANTTTNSMFMMKGNTGAFEWSMGRAYAAYDRGTQVSWWNHDGSDFQAEISYDTHPLNRWDAVAAAFGSPATVGARFSVYRNTGTPLPTRQPASFTDGTRSNTTTPIRIPQASWGQPVNGSVRHVAIFQGMKSSGIISAIMHAGRAEGLIP